MEQATRKQYDLICSLGGNCSVAHNLRFRNMRPFSLPFDWCYILDDAPIYKLAECFDNNFKFYCLKENLQELPENSAHKDKVQYKDTYTGYIYANHFSKSINDCSGGGNEYMNFKAKQDRRIERLYSEIEKGSKILFLLSTSFEIGIDCVANLKRALEQKWNNKVFDFIVMSFNCSEDSTIENNGIMMIKYKRGTNLYDFIYTNYEWAFLDKITLSNVIKKRNYHIFKIAKLRRGIKILILTRIATICRIRLKCLGLRFELCIGKESE